MVLCLCMPASTPKKSVKFGLRMGAAPIFLSLGSHQTRSVKSRQYSLNINPDIVPAFSKTFSVKHFKLYSLAVTLYNNKRDL